MQLQSAQYFSHRRTFSGIEVPTVEQELPYVRQSVENAVARIDGCNATQYSAGNVVTISQFKIRVCPGEELHISREKSTAPMHVYTLTS